MPDFLEYDPVTGVRRMFDYDEQTGTSFVRAEQNVQHYLDIAQAARNEKLCDVKGRSFQLAFWLPPVVQLELRKKGIDIYSKDETMIRRMFQEIERNYPRFKMTDKKFA